MSILTRLSPFILFEYLMLYYLSLYITKITLIVQASMYFYFDIVTFSNSMLGLTVKKLELNYHSYRITNCFYIAR